MPGSGGKGDEVAALALALSLLHWWGVEHALDQQLYDLLADLQLHVLVPQVIYPPLYFAFPYVHTPDRCRFDSGPL